MTGFSNFFMGGNYATLFLHQLVIECKNKRLLIAIRNKKLLKLKLLN